MKNYVDAVINHMPGGGSTGPGSGGSTYSHYSYPAVPYGSNDFHHCGRNGNADIANYTDRYEVQNCELVDLSDLATEASYVQGKQQRGRTTRVIPTARRSPRRWARVRRSMWSATTPRWPVGHLRARCR